jgi:hypothetical protein
VRSNKGMWRLGHFMSAVVCSLDVTMKNVARAMV